MQRTNELGGFHSAHFKGPDPPPRSRQKPGRLPETVWMVALFELDGATGSSAFVLEYTALEMVLGADAGHT